MYLAYAPAGGRVGDRSGRVVEQAPVVKNTSNVAVAGNHLHWVAIFFVPTVVLRSFPQPPKQILFRIDCPVRSDISTVYYVKRY